MILVVFAALCLLSVPLTGGHVSRLAHIQLRGLWLAAVAIGVQIVITAIATHGSHSFHADMHIVSYVFAGLFLWANRRLPGIWLISAGAGMNALAIVVNHGVMPASATAERLSGLKLGTGFNNSAHLAHAHLAWLGDIIPFPGPAPLHNVLSVGDCLLYAGMLVLLHKVCRRPVAAVATGASAPAPRPLATSNALDPRPARAGLTARGAAAASQLAPTGPRPSRPRPRHPVPGRPLPRRPAIAGLDSLAPLGIAVAGFVLAFGVGSRLAPRER